MVIVHPAVQSASKNRRKQKRVKRLKPGPTRSGLLAMAILAPLASLGCQQYDDTTFDPRIIRQLETDHASEQPRSILGKMPTTLESTPTVPRGSTTLPAKLPTTGQSIPASVMVRLSLREILQRSVANSAEVRVAGYEPAISATRVIEAKARFDMRVFSNVFFQRQGSQNAGSFVSVPNSNPLNPFTSVNTTIDRADTYTVEAGVRQLLPAGGEARLTYSINNTYNEPARFRLNPFWEQELKFEITQPLLQNFGTEVNAARIRIAQNDQRISILEFRGKLEDNLSELEKDYWQLYQAVREVDIQEALLQQTIETYSTLFDRSERGIDPSKVPTLQAESAVHARKAALVQAKQRIRDISSDIKRRMNDPEFPVAGNKVIMPFDAPLISPVNFDLDQMVASAVINRHELSQQIIRRDSAAIAQKVAKNAELPSLNLIVEMMFNGVDRSYTSSLNELGNFNHFGGRFGLQFEYPLGNREALAISRRAYLQRLQAEEQYRNLVGQVTLDVVTALNDVNSSWEQIIARQQSRLATTEQLRLIQDQEVVGTAKIDPPFVNVKLQAQSDLASAAREEAAAIAAYNTAIQRLERAKGTLLRYNNIMMEEDKSFPLPPTSRW